MCNSCHPDQLRGCAWCEVSLPMRPPSGSTPDFRSRLPRPMDGRQVSTLTMWVRVLLGAPCFSPVRGSYPAACQFESDRGGHICVRGGTRHTHDVENVGIVGSSPTERTN